MRRTLAVFAGLFAILLVPLSLSGPTGWLLLPAHLLFTALCAAGTLAEAAAGRAERARLWGLFYLVATVVMVGALEAAAQLRGESFWYWAPAFTAVMIWGWVPPTLSGLAGTFADWWQRRLDRNTVRRRRRELSDTDRRRPVTGDAQNIET